MSSLPLAGKAVAVESHDGLNDRRSATGRERHHRAKQLKKRAMWQSFFVLSLVRNLRVLQADTLSLANYLKRCLKLLTL